MPLGALYGLGAALMWGLTDVTATFAGRRIGSLRVLALSQILGFLVLVAIALVLGVTLPEDPELIAVSLLVGLAGTGAYLSFFTALRIGPLSVVSPITAAYGGLTVVLAVLLRGETLTGNQAIGAAVATVGIVLTGIVFDGGMRGVRIVGRGVVLAFIALVLFAVMTIGLAGPIGEAGWLPIILVSRVANVVASTVLLVVGLGLRPRVLGPLIEAPLPAMRHAFVLGGVAGLLDAVGLVVFAIGLERAETWLVGLTSSFGPAVAVIVAVGALHERPRSTQWAGLGAIGVGLGAVALG